jgi:hypothetical protein
MSHPYTYDEEEFKDWTYDLHQAAEHGNKEEVQKALAHLQSMQRAGNVNDPDAVAAQNAEDAIDPSLAVAGSLAQGIAGDVIPAIKAAPYMHNPKKYEEKLGEARQTEQEFADQADKSLAVVGTGTGARDARRLGTGISLGSAALGVAEAAPSLVRAGGRGAGHVLKFASAPFKTPKQALANLGDKALQFFAEPPAPSMLRTAVEDIGRVNVPEPPPRAPQAGLTPEIAAQGSWEASGRPQGFRASLPTPEAAPLVPEPGPRTIAPQAGMEEVPRMIREAVQSAPPRGLQTLSELPGRQSVLRGPTLSPTRQAESYLTEVPPPAERRVIDQSVKVERRGQPTPAQQAAAAASPISKPPVVEGKGMGRAESEYAQPPETPIHKAIPVERELTKQGKPGEAAKVLRQAVQNQREKVPAILTKEGQMTENAADLLAARTRYFERQGLPLADAQEMAAGNTHVPRAELDKELARVRKGK